MQRLRGRGIPILGSVVAPELKKKARNSWAALQDTYFSTKDIFERHRVVFTVGTSIASIATAWFGYSLRHYHETKIDQRLQSIEGAMRNSHHLEHTELKKLVDPGNSRTAATIATAGTSLVIGYALGWRGGIWYADRKIRREQMRMIGQLKPKSWQLLGRIKPRGWPVRFLRKPLPRQKASDNSVRPSESTMKEAAIPQQ